MGMQDKIRLYSSIAMPSTMSGYSMACAYIERWFLKRFSDNYFKAFNVDETHMSKAFDKAKILKNLKALKPSCFIIPKFDFDFDREGIDLNLGGIDSYMRRDCIDRSFFKDKQKNMNLFLQLEQIQVGFTFRVRVSTRAQQLDLVKYMQMAFRIKQTQGEDVDMDFHIPDSIILQIAQDAGFEVEDNIIKNIPEFIKYMNRWSAFPILYKYRSVNGKSEFFVRLNDLYVHISCLDNLSADDGEYEGQLKSNYIIEMNVVLKMAAPKFYAYYSKNKHDAITTIETNNDYSVGLYNIQIPNIPENNDKGWSRYLYTEIFEDDKSKPLEIEIKSLFEDGDIGRLIKNNNDILISSSTFLEIKLFNAGKEIDYILDWSNYSIKSKELLVSENTYMAVYIDMEYVNTQIIAIDSLYKDSIRGV